MPGTVVQELLRILRSSRRKGVKNVWLSSVNQEAMKRLFAGGGRGGMTPPAARPAAKPVPRSEVQAAPAAPASMPFAKPQSLQSEPPQNRPAAASSAASPSVSSAVPVQSRQSSPGIHRREPVTGDYQSCASMDYPSLAAAVSDCRKCRLCQQVLHGVAGEGVPGSRLMMIGGHASSVSPDTPAGVMLTNIISAMKMVRGGTDPSSGVYITSILKCSAEGIVLTSSREAECCMGYLQRQIELVNPEIIVLLGALPMRCLLGQVGIQKFHGQWFQYKNIPVLPVIEPEYILRFEKQPSFFMKYKREIWNDLKQVMARLNTAK